MRGFSRPVAQVSQVLPRHFANMQVVPKGNDPEGATMRKILFAATALISLAAINAASAADLALKAPPPAPMVDPWSGWYVGVNIGGSWGRARDTATYGAASTLLGS